MTMTMVYLLDELNYKIATIAIKHKTFELDSSTYGYRIVSYLDILTFSRASASGWARQRFTYIQAVSCQRPTRQN